jgi:penicillin-binding protein 1B
VSTRFPKPLSRFTELAARTFAWLRQQWRRAWPWLRAPFWLGLGLLIGFGVPYGIHLDGLVRQRFAELHFAQPSRVYARPLRLAVGVPMNAATLKLELGAARYGEAAQAFQPGTFHVDGTRFDIATRAFGAVQGRQPERRLSVTVSEGRIKRVVDSDTGKALTEAFVDPARIATLYGKKQIERRIVRAADVPPLLIATLQAVEDRDFKSHHGVDPWAIVRAAWVNFRRGEVVQGGSTLTQQLVRNLFLDRSRTLVRKFNEAALALLIEARFSKQQILEAYLNEVYLGQQGGQAVHGVAAASEFYFGHDLRALDVSETALMIGMIQGPSLYDPRRFPERAKTRRDIVINVMHEVGLINATDRAVARKSALGVIGAGALPRNRYPAFLELVRDQLARDFPDSVLRSEGLVVLTTLAPSTQQYAESAVAERIKAMGKAGARMEAAVVVTDAKGGAVEAMVGGKNSDAQGFNRALNAARPIGSLVKPFVYLVALARPDEWNLSSQLSDRAISVPLPNGTTWRPANIDGVEHGDVALIDALARSYNLATVHLGMAVDHRTVERVLEALIPGADVSPHPSLLLGATDLSPYQVAQAYQYLASDGRPTALYALDAVFDAQGRALTRYAQKPVAGDLVATARLVGYALQETAVRGTASSLVGLGLGRLKVAGKTGTSNDQRDSWFAGYTGSHLAVVWLGTDDNQATGLFGSTGSLRVWASLFAKQPTEPLTLALGQDPHFAWVDPHSQRQTDPDCPGARQLPFARGHEPAEVEHCGWDRFRDYFGGEDDRAANTEDSVYDSDAGHGADTRALRDDAVRERDVRDADDATTERPKRRFRDFFRRDRDRDADRERERERELARQREEQERDLRENEF